MVAAVVTAWALLITAPAMAQAPQDARLIVVVTDPSGAVIRGAAVTLAAEEEAPRVTVPALVTSAAGSATFAALKPGRYTLTAEFDGFDIGVATGVLKADDWMRETGNRRPHRILNNINELLTCGVIQ